MPKHEELDSAKPIPMVKWSQVKTLERLSELIDKHGAIYLIDTFKGVPIKVTRAGIH